MTTDSSLSLAEAEVDVQSPLLQTVRHSQPLFGRGLEAACKGKRHISFKKFVELLDLFSSRSSQEKKLHGDPSVSCVVLIQIGLFGLVNTDSDQKLSKKEFISLMKMFIGKVVDASVVGMSCLCLAELCIAKLRL